MTEPRYRTVFDWPLVIFMLVLAALVASSSLLGCLAWMVGCTFGYVLGRKEEAAPSDQQGQS